MRTERIVRSVAVLSIVAALGVAGAQVADQQVQELENVGVEEHLDRRIPLDLRFVDSDWRRLVLGELFDGERPVVLNLVYYRCPMLCGLVLNGVADSVAELEWDPGDEYRLVTVSIDAGETPDLARAKKESYLRQLERPGIGDGWTFLVGTEPAIDELADAVGFGFEWVEARNEFAHPAVTMVLTPDARVARYLYGIQYDPKNLRLALLEASEGEVGSSLDRLIMYCFHYDPDERSYTVAAMNVMRLGGAVTVLVLGTVLGVFFVRDRRRKARD